MMSALTSRQEDIKRLLDRGMAAREIARELGISRNAVYQQIQRMRRHGALDPTFTPSGQPTREQRPGEDVLRQLVPTLSGENADLTQTAGVAAILVELTRTRDELDAIARRLSLIVPR